MQLNAKMLFSMEDMFVLVTVMLAQITAQDLQVSTRFLPIYIFCLNLNLVTSRQPHPTPATKTTLTKSKNKRTLVILFFWTCAVEMRFARMDAIWTLVFLARVKLRLEQHCRKRFW